MFGSDSDDWPDDVYKVLQKMHQEMQTMQPLMDLRQRMQTMQPPKDLYQQLQTMQPPSLHGFEHWEYKRSFPVMELVVGLAVAGALVFLVILLCRCCRGKTRGRVLAPPPAPGSEPAAPYPQQQYTHAAQAYPAATVTVYPVGTASPYPAAVGPYPGVAPYPTASPYPAAAPYPPGGASPYPAGGASPYPAGSAAPYPTGAPYPAVTPYGQGPSAPDANACPPSYEQVMQHHEKQPPYNPHAPH